MTGTLVRSSTTSWTKRTAAEWSLRWVWGHPEVTVVLSAMNEGTNIEENLTVADKAYPNSLTEAEMQPLKKVEWEVP